MKKTGEFDFEKIFQLLDEMEACVGRIRELRRKMEENWDV